MNWTSEYVLALYSITLATEGSLLFLSHLLYRTHHVCLLMILSFSSPLLVFFYIACQKKIETCLCATNPRPPVIIIQVDCWLTANWMRREREKKEKTRHLFIKSRKPIQDSITLFLSIEDWISIAWQHTHILSIAVSYCRDGTCVCVYLWMRKEEEKKRRVVYCMHDQDRIFSCICVAFHSSS